MGKRRKICCNCCYFVANRVEHDGEKHVFTQCRRYPPSVTDDGSEYPSVGMGAWCGEYEETTELKMSMPQKG